MLRLLNKTILNTTSEKLRKISKGNKEIPNNSTQFEILII